MLRLNLEPTPGISTFSDDWTENSGFQSIKDKIELWFDRSRSLLLEVHIIALDRKEDCLDLELFCSRRKMCTEIFRVLEDRMKRITSLSTRIDNSLMPPFLKPGQDENWNEFPGLRLQPNVLTELDLDLRSFNIYDGLPLDLSNSSSLKKLTVHGPNIDPDGYATCSEISLLPPPALRVLELHRLVLRWHADAEPFKTSVKKISIDNGWIAAELWNIFDKVFPDVEVISIIEPRRTPRFWRPFDQVLEKRGELRLPVVEKLSLTLKSWEIIERFICPRVTELEIREGHLCSKQYTWPSDLRSVQRFLNNSDAKLTKFTITTRESRLKDIKLLLLEMPFLEELGVDLIDGGYREDLDYEKKCLDGFLGELYESQHGENNPNTSGSLEGVYLICPRLDSLRFKDHSGNTFFTSQAIIDLVNTRVQGVLDGPRSKRRVDWKEISLSISSQTLANTNRQLCYFSAIDFSIKAI